MSWKNFLEALCNCREYELTPLETEVLMCLQETKCPTKKDLLEIYITSYSIIEEEAFTQRLKNIYKKFQITGKGYKLPQLHKYLTEKYIQYQNKDIFFSQIGLTYIYPIFPSDTFGKEIDKLIHVDNPEQKRVDILQTFAPNLDDYFEHLTRCIQNDVQVRILLAWPYSEAAKLRENVLRRYANTSISDEINICDYVIANLETLEKIIRVAGGSKLLDVKLYDTLPSLAIYRAGDYMLAAPFLHGSLAINTFQLELKLNTSNELITHTLRDDFELMWQVARRFYPDPNINWRNDLKILFTN
ncbi:MULTISPECIES: hypothetical protein [Nostoc]|uniref:WYL domain-containing protein n=1 Tax=Nostoc paludosum FACHB-159 TaxID=2692908 RepID=A0ABR8K2D7_9NOSO|nr:MULTISPECIES: hypothetical protein [Nostoc]MBD2677289.1 hypothetical protein [Nostoc sp. FACHB-857]MBD2732901.1 hypothetical protein [Nostoc paludosum FACHB-159]